MDLKNPKVLEYLGCNAMDKDNIITIWSKNGVCTITLNRPDVKNAFNESMIENLQSVMEKVSNNKDLRVLIITGTGDSFSAGADLNWMKKSIHFSKEENIKDANKFAKMLKTLDNFGRPTIAKINGHVFGGGLGIIASCDFAVSADSAKYCFSEVKLGLTPAMISPYIIRSIGETWARRLFLSGQVFDSKLALKINLLSKVVPLEDLNIEINYLVKLLLKGAPNAQGMCKKLIKKVNNSNINKELINYTLEKIAQSRSSEEGKDGMSAFLNKHKAKWLVNDD